MTICTKFVSHLFSVCFLKLSKHCLLYFTAWRRYSLCLGSVVMAFGISLIILIPHSDVIHYSEVSHIFQGFLVGLSLVIVEPNPGIIQVQWWSNRRWDSRPMRSTTVVLAVTFCNTSFPPLKLSGFWVPCSWAAMSCFCLSLSLLLKCTNGIAFCVKYNLWFFIFWRTASATSESDLLYRNMSWRS